MEETGKAIYTGIRLPRDVRREVHLIAAERGESISDAGVYLIRLGLDALKGRKDTSIEAQELAATIAAGRA